MYASKPGRDHLGLGSVSSDQILPSLSPSINVLTFHPRYHSFYVFLLDEFWQRDRPRSRSSLIQFYRPREFIFSVGSYLCDRPEHKQIGHIVGGQKTEPLATREHKQYLTNTDYIDSELGGYGLYYRTVMTELGIIYPGGQGFPYPVDVPSEYGKEVAEAFRQDVKHTQYYREYFDKDECEVPIDVIREYIRFACLCQLQTSHVHDRPYLLDTFLHRGSQLAAESRRATFRLFLDISKKTAENPLNEDLFRQLVYFKKTENGIAYSPEDIVASSYEKWRLYQAREYYTFALNTFWYYLCDWGVRHGGDIQPIPVGDFFHHLSEEVDFSRLASTFDLPDPGLRLSSGFRSLEDWLLSLVGTTRPDFDVACGIDCPIHEHRLYQKAIQAKNHPDVDSMVTGMIIMCALISLRFGGSELRGKPEWNISRMGAGGRLSVDDFIRALEKRLKSGPVTIEEILRWLYEDHVILQHQLIATNKLPDNTFRFRREGNKLHFFNIFNTLDFMNSRFEAISTTVHELGLSGNFSLPDHSPSPDGMKLLAEGDL